MAARHYTELRDLLLRQAYSHDDAPVVVRDAGSHYVPLPITERLVHCLWYDQRVRATALQTSDGQPLRVIFPGWWNLEAGPDFRHATIQIGTAPERTGDVEIHLRAADWFHHGHDRDPAYDNVILHVVLWEDDPLATPVTRAGEPLPQLILQPFLDAPLEQLYDEIDLDAYPHNVGNHAGPCGALFQKLTAAAIGRLLDSAGDERFAGKVRKFIRWIRATDAEQAFYTGWMEALGYKNNKAAFRKLAQQLPVASLRQAAPSALPSVLFGVANFLPTAAPVARDTAGQRYVKRLWNTWWKLRPDYEPHILPRDAWRLHGIRPANHPHRRLGAAAALLQQHPALLDELTGAVQTGGDPATLFRQLRDEYWSRHFTLGGRTQAAATDLIGAARAQELVTNVVLPFLAARAELDGDSALRAKARAADAAMAGAPVNSLLRLACQQLFDTPAAVPRWLKTNRHQQGVLQIFQDFCVNDKSGCRACRFPEMIQRWADAAL
jgi:hypothetical protein